jgi:hypothetical protein
MSVTKNCDMVIAYGGKSINAAQTLFPEARYCVYYLDSRGLKRGRVVMKGGKSRA